MTENVLEAVLGEYCGAKKPDSELQDSESGLRFFVGCGRRGSRLAVIFDGALDDVHRLAIERVAAAGPVAAAVVGVGARFGGYGHLVVVVEGLGALFQVAFFVVFAPLGPEQQLVGSVLVDVLTVRRVTTVLSGW